MKIIFAHLPLGLHPGSSWDVSDTMVSLLIIIFLGLVLFAGPTFVVLLRKNAKLLAQMKNAGIEAVEGPSYDIDDGPVLGKKQIFHTEVELIPLVIWMLKVVLAFAIAGVIILLPVIIMCVMLVGVFLG